jgi:hypothetical protein
MIFVGRLLSSQSGPQNSNEQRFNLESYVRSSYCFFLTVVFEVLGHTEKNWMSIADS